MNLFYLAIKNNSKKYSFIRVSVPLDRLENISANIRNFLIITFIVAFLSTFILSYIISMIISNPINQFVKATKTISEGDYSSEISINSKDELGDLAKSFNAMSKQIENRINEIIDNESRFKAIFLSMFNGMMVVDPDSYIRLVNKSLMDIFQLEEDVIGKKPIEVFRAVVIQSIADKALDLNNRKVNKEISVNFPEEKILIVNANPIVSDGNCLGAVLVFHDITELRRLEKIRRDFVANVSHELRTPIANIKGFSETLINGAINDTANVEDFLNIIQTEADRLSALINDLLDLSKIESGQLDVRLDYKSLKKSINKVVYSIYKHNYSKNSNIIVNVPDDFPEIPLDGPKFSQIILNLIDNALKYSGENSTVEINAKLEDDKVVIEVKDDGVGIPEEDLPRVFERFYRVDKARSRELGGTGLGLAIVKHLVQALNGTVEADSVVDEGTTITIRLPLQQNIK
jgi:two-component system phosphate regulon sensor histidine kinase PhoR